MWRLLNDLAFRARAIFRRDDADRDLQDEFAHHRAMLVAELRATGASTEEAEREANVSLGSVAAESERALPSSPRAFATARLIGHGLAALPHAPYITER